MASEITAAGGAVNNILPELILSSVQDYIYSESIMLPLTKVVDLSGQPTLTAAFQFAPGATAGAVTDGTALSNSTWTASNATIACSEVGVKKEITDLAVSACVDDIVAVISRDLSLGLMEKYETDACALLGGFSNTVGTTTAAITFGNMAEAINTLRKNAKSFTARGQVVCVLYPEQIYDLQLEGLSKTAGLAPAVSRPLMGLYGDRAGDNLMQAQAGSFMGVPVFSHNLVPTANTGADSAGAMFVAGEALGTALKWAGKVEMQREVNNGTMGWTLLSSMAYGVGELRDALGVSIITDR